MRITDALFQLLQAQADSQLSDLLVFVLTVKSTRLPFETQVKPGSAALEYRANLSHNIIDPTKFLLHRNLRDHA